MRKFLRFALSAVMVTTMFFYAGDNFVKAANSYDLNDIGISEANKWLDKESNTFKYPITVDSKEWKDYKTHDEMLAVCTIPKELLAEMSTDNLVELVLDYPLLCDLLAYNTLQQGLEAVKQQYNGLEELLSREDAADMLLAKYQETEILASSSLPIKLMTKFKNDGDISAVLAEIQKSDTLYKKIRNESKELLDTIFLEMMLVQDEIVNDFSAEELNILNMEALHKYKEKSNSDMYRGLEDTYFEEMENNGNEKMLGDINIIKINNSDINNEISILSSTTYVYTPNGTSVLVFINDFYGYSVQVLTTNNFVAQYPQADLVVAATNMYNCHSYAWYSQNQYATSGYWMNYPDAYINDGSYYRVGGGLSPTAQNQKAVWMSSGQYIHSGIVYEVYNRTITSKWGNGPLFRHASTYSPYSGGIYYYTR